MNGHNEPITAVQLAAELFETDTPHEYRQSLLNWLILAMSSNDFDTLSANERSNLACMFKQLINFIDKLEKLFNLSTATQPELNMED